MQASSGFLHLLMSSRYTDRSFVRRRKPVNYHYSSLQHCFIGKSLIGIEVVNLCLCFFVAWWPYIIVLSQYSFLTDAWVGSGEPTYSSEMFSQRRVKHTGVTIDAGEYALVQ
jgi:hypothetical protein